MGDHFSAFGKPQPPPPPPPPPPLPASKESQDRWAVCLTRNPCLPCFNALLLHFKSSTVFSKCWNWQLCQSLATLNNPPFKSGSANPDSVESCDGAHRGRPLCPPTVRRVRVMSGAPKIPKGRIQQEFLYSIYYTSFTRRIYELEKKVYLSWLPFAGAHQSLSLLKSPPSRRASFLSPSPLRPLQPCWTVWY